MSWRRRGFWRAAAPARRLVGCLAVAAVSGCAALAPVQPPGALERADDHFESGEYEAAAAAYEEHLKLAPAAEEVDRALFQLGVIRTLSGHGASDRAAGRAHLRRLVDAYPASPWAELARYLLDLDLEVRELRRRIDELKRIDLDESG